MSKAHRWHAPNPCSSAAPAAVRPSSGRGSAHCEAMEHARARHRACARRAIASRAPRRQPRPGSAARLRRRGAAPVSGMAELDRVFGGGLVPGLGDAPGRRSGHRQVDAAAAGGRARWRGTRPVLYASGEESVAQVACAPSASDSAARSCALVAETDLTRSWRLPRARRRRCWSSTRSRRAAGDGGRSAPVRSRSCANAPRRWCASPKRSGTRGDHRRPRHQGRRDRGTEAARAPGRHRAVFRAARPAAAIASCAPPRTASGRSTSSASSP